MSSMPERDAPGQPGSTQQSARPGDYGAPAPGAVPGQEQRYGSPGQPQGGMSGQPGGDWGSQPGRASPVNEAETRVTWRRIFQYWIDAFLVWIVPYLVSIPFDSSGSRLVHILGGVVAFVLFVLIGVWYWVIRPHSHNGQTFAMQWLGLRVISKHGGPANMTQMFIRWICLIFDGFPWMWPFTGLLGLIVMLCSRYRQRIGDHLARTLVISTRSAVFQPDYPQGSPAGQYGQGSPYAQSGGGQREPDYGEGSQYGQPMSGRPTTVDPRGGQAMGGQTMGGQSGAGQSSLDAGMPGTDAGQQPGPGQAMPGGEVR
jgi:uncharacterized RDD family membrane protein YckC